MRGNVLLDAALEYAERGWRVLPLHNLVDGGGCSCDAWRTANGLEPCRKPGKHPRFTKWAEKASTDSAPIRAWWKEWPSANVGVVSGKASNTLVLDSDPRNGGDWSRRRLIEKYGVLGDCPTAVTGGKGLHEHFRWPDELQTDQGGLELDDGLEVLLEGHNVVMPPSYAHAGRDPYFWDREPEREMLPAPSWLVALIRAKLQPPAGGGRKPESGGTKWPPADFGAIVRGCAWLRSSVERAASLSEPEWYAQLSIIGRCENGEQIAQDVSSAYAGYSGRETAAKLAHAVRDAGPATCAKIRHSLGGGRFCEQCTARVRSPVVLGIATSTRRKLQAPPDDPGAGGRDEHGSDDPARPETNDKERLPRICVTNRHLRDISDESMAALRMGNEPPLLFARGGLMVAVRRNEKGRQEMFELTEAAVRGELTRSADYFKVNASGASAACYPPLEVVRDVLALSPAAWGFPVLDAVVEAPVLRGDGSVLDRAGYDAPTRLYYAPEPSLRLPAIAEAPVRDHVEVGVGLIDDLFGEFPFDGKASRANAFAALLTPIVRPAIEAPAPMALFDAPQAGTGKSLLADVISIVATGRAGEMFSAPRDEDEWRKQITTALASGTAVVVIDNVSRRLDNPDLCKTLTEMWHVDRAFRTHQKMVLPAKAVWMATGNNIQLGGDMPRRCYRIRLDAQTSRPFLRTGFKHADLKAWALAHRGELLAALLTIARAWYLAGRPKPRITPLGSYEAWSTTVGGILEYADVHGFLANAEAVYEEADAESAQWEGFLQTLNEVFYGEAFTVHQLVERLKAQTWNGEASEPCVQATMLREALPDLLAEAVDRQGFFQRRVGKAFAERVERRFGASQVYLKRGPTVHKVQAWIVVRPDEDKAASSTKQYHHTEVES